jgi:mRNA-degrading endonuclease RelE of RelBE toxin-antitoxin system
VAAALQIWSPTFTRAFDALPLAIRENVQRKIDEMGTRLAEYPHKRLTGRAECKLRAEDYRILYEFDVSQGRLYLHYVGNRREIYKRG